MSLAIASCGCFYEKKNLKKATTTPPPQRKSNYPKAVIYEYRDSVDE
jgi:hypothetical protein